MSSLPDAPLQPLRDAHRAVTGRIADAAARRGRDPRDITLVAVTKSASLAQIMGLINLGQIDLGESRAQQLDQRAEAVAQAIADAASQSSGSAALAPPRWHMIGHLQRNKVKQIAPLAHLIHSVDSLRLAEELDAFAARHHPAAPIDVLIQVNIASEAQKYGLTIPQTPEAVQQLNALPHLRLRGLMTMAPYADRAEESRPVFARAAALFQELKASATTGEPFNVLSMGMSNDYEVAIEEGANVVRIGRALFES